MRKALRHSLVAALALAGPAAFAQPPAPPRTPAAAPAAKADAVAATVNGQPIYESALQRGLERIPEKRRAEARPELINFFIDNALVEQYLVQLRVTVEPKDVTQRLDEMKAEVKKASQDFDKMMTEMHLTEAELREHISADLRWEKFVTQQSDEARLKALFDNNKDMFNGSMVRARHILLTPPAGDASAAEAAKAKLRQCKQKIEATVAQGLAKLPANADKLAVEKARIELLDEAFMAEAKAESACPSKAQGGDLGWFERVGLLVEPLSQAAFALQPYQMTDVVATPFGFHLMLVTDRKAGREYKYEEVKERVKEVYGEKLREAVIAQMRPRAKVVIAGAAKP
jgi:peptidyl-prolyl cis-trans isomerase C